MARRERRPEDQTAGHLDPESGVESGIEAQSTGSEKPSRRRATKVEPVEEESRTKVTLSLGHEVAWRLRVLAEMQGTTPGRLVEPLIVPYLKKEALPYDRYRRKGFPPVAGSDDMSAA
ncbi:hypothetical protein SAMN05444166_6267 [Singulisphaera sp. GP187]|uniref:hypothetical protein n=1 Tax=Singulisphaera sp. GP187 TaxID=1882752 RepID=UPI0009287D4F|nr:hypothetical protein [Singulisphaera sp. GP187]SIO60101.1 hypothetical protein SAMN05444166_6267 [Singulisphaera sp. GP187]